MFEIGNAELDERNQYITYHNISVTVSFLMRLNEFDEPNHMSIARDDCLAYFTFDLRLYLDEDNYLEPISYNVTSFVIADLDLFRLKLYKDKISNKESAIEQILSTFTLERLYNISRMYPMSDQDYYFTILVNHLINQKYFDLSDIQLDFEQITFLHLFYHTMIKKQFYDIKFKVGISTEGESIITNITIPNLTLTRNMFNIEGNIIISDPGMSIISMKNAINYCLYLIVKTLEWE